MGGWLKDKEHLVRAGLLLAAGLSAFLVVRSVAVPRHYGVYGPFRPGALEDNAARPVSFAGHAACEECHTDVVEARHGSKHEQIHCEICHGPAAAHAADPASAKPVLPDGRAVCINCHAANIARPAWFPQIDVESHAGEEKCTSCHNHHHPEPEGS